MFSCFIIQVFFVKHLSLQLNFSIFFALYIQKLMIYNFKQILYFLLSLNYEDYLIGWMAINQGVTDSIPGVPYF